MRRRPAWRRFLRGGVGTSGLTAAFLLGMAAAILWKLMFADAGMSESGGSPARSDVGATAQDVRDDGSERTGGLRPEQDGGGEAVGAGARNGGAVGQAGGAGARNGGAVGQAAGRFGQAEAPDEPLVRVYLTDEKRVETVPLEAYVRGVVAGEMPADFELEALKAQAIAARTYIVRKLLAAARNAGGDDPDYDVTDGESDQVYVPLHQIKEMQRERKDDFKRIGRAVAETEGLVLTYAGEPIQAVYFSTSGGYTENAEDYWSSEVPYLKSVPSPWDAQLSPQFERKVEMALDEFYDRLGIGLKDRKGGIEVLSRTQGRSVKEIRIGKKTLSGRKVREALDLPSANFSLQIKGGRITLTCFGNGHGVGMSQWGAQALAMAGNSAEQILAYYYRGARLARSESLAASSESFKT